MLPSKAEYRIEALEGELNATAVQQNEEGSKQMGEALSSGDQI